MSDASGRFLQRSIPLALLFAIGFAQAALAQSTPPLNFGNNFFVTGDYVVAGAYGMATHSTTINGVSYAVGTISVPDSNPGITWSPDGTSIARGTNNVPTGAQIVAALLYWQTVEKVGVAPGAPGSGQNGYFRPLLYQNSGGPAAPGYAISGTNVSGSTTVSWSSGGCTSGSTGKILRTYRADVAGGLPLDANGNPTANSSFEVRLPSAGNSTPLTLGATLVVIYRIPTGAGGPTIPLNAIVIYDGDYAQSNAQLTMTQQVQGFYDVDHNAVSRLTHIAGSGQSNKFQTVYLGPNANSLTTLPSLYGNQLPAFPGWYGNWDNPTWTFTSTSVPGNPLQEDASTATTQVVPSTSNQGCVSWGAVIVSTTVKNPDSDGILHSWKLNQGYCDVSVNPSCGPGDPAWVDLTGAVPGEQDIFLQYDYMCSTVSNGSCVTGGNDYSFDPRLAVDTEDSLSPPHADAVDKVVAAYAAHNIHLHAIPGNAIEENQPNITCTNTDLTCPFPNEPGTVGFRYGLENIKNSNIDTQTGIMCDPASDANCVPVFQHGKKDSYHYALFAHGVALPNWFLWDGSLSSVKQSGNTVTFTTASPIGVAQIVQRPNFATATDTTCPFGRVTVVSAVTNPNMDGTFCILSNPAPTPTTFAITVPGSPTTVTYTAKTEPFLGVANGQVTSMSGFSDVGGQNLVVALGYGGWGPANNPASDGNKWQSKAGTFIHELGHNMALTHGGTFYNNLPSDYTPTFEANCKPNVQSNMSYLFQFDLLQVPGQLNAAGQPLMVVDYSEDPMSPGLVPTLTKSQPPGGTENLNLTYANTADFQLTSYAVSPAPTALTLSSVANASGGNTVYTGTITGGGGNAFAGSAFSVAGFTNAANNGTFVVIASTLTTLTLSNASGVAETHPGTAGTALSPHCDDTPVVKTDQPMTYVPFSPSSFFWSNATGLDINFTGSSTGELHPHNEWGGTPAEGDAGLSPGLDLQQVSAIGTLTTVGPGGTHLGGGGGGTHLGGGGGGTHLGGGGGGTHLGGGGGGLGLEPTHEATNSYARPARTLTIVQEEASPRYVDLSWFAPTFGTVVNYNVYRSVGTGAFMLLASVPGTQTTYTDKTDTCNQAGYNYRVTSVIQNDSGQTVESVPSNTVPATGEPLVTGCYVVTSFSPSLANTVQGTIVPITWILTDDFYVTPGSDWQGATAGNPVTNINANSLVANGPTLGACAAGGATSILANGTATPQSGTSTFMNTNPNTGLFTFNWDTDPFCAGSYTFTLTLDSTQTQTTTSSSKLSIDINDQDNPSITTLALPSGTVGLAYNAPALTEDGGTSPFTWSVSNLPVGIALQPPGSPNISGTACVAGSYNSIMASVTDKNGNMGSRGLTLKINPGNTATSVVSNANPSVFQQTLIFTVTVASAPASSCTPTGTVTLLDGANQIASGLLTNGSATFSLPLGQYNPSVGVHSITASYAGDGNFKGSTSGVWSQTVNPAQTAIVVNSILVNTLSPSTVFVGQPVTVSYTLSVQPPAAASPIAPTGNITVTASDGSACSVALLTPCTLSPAPKTVGNVTFLINYSGDGNFVASGANGNYNVYQLVFATPPSNTEAGRTITPSVVVTAEDGNNNTFTGFTGGITLAVGSSPGVLSGTTTQNAVAGVATFGNLSINKVANGYTLTASPAGGVPAATSSAFNIGTFDDDD